MMDDVAPLVRQRFRASLVALCAFAFVATGCQFLGEQGDIEIRSTAMGSDFVKHYVPQDEMTPIEPGTRFELEVREYCPDETRCREDNLEVQDVRFEQNSEVLVFHGSRAGGRIDKSEMIELEAVGRGESTMIVEFTRRGKARTLERHFEVVEPNGIGLRDCSDRRAILYGARVTLLRSVLHYGRRMISNGIDSGSDTDLFSFDPPGALVPEGDGAFQGRFRKIEPGHVRVLSPHTIHYGDYYGYEPVDGADGSLRYQGVEVTSESEIDV